ncbi:MAG: metallophosphoesterase [Clostridia bacterium]
MKRILLSIIIIASMCALVTTSCSHAQPKVIDVCPEPQSNAIPKHSAAPAIAPYVLPSPKQDALSVKNGVYTFAWLSDTQHYSEEYPRVFYVMTDFLARNRERLDLRYALHTGDLIHNFGSEGEWQTASAAMDNLKGIPYGVLAGNHDSNFSNANYSNFCRYFGKSRFEDFSYYGGSFEDNRCHYDLIDAGETNYIFVFIGYPPTPAAYEWVNQALRAYPDRVGILCTHDYFKTSMELSDNGQAIFDRVISENPNVYMLLCGHRYNIGHTVSHFDDDGNGTAERSVYQIMGNYQAAQTQGGGGYMRFIQIDEASAQMRILSYSPLLNDYVYYDTPEHQTEKYAADPDDETIVLPLPWH